MITYYIRSLRTEIYYVGDTKRRKTDQKCPRPNRVKRLIYYHLAHPNSVRLLVITLAAINLAGETTAVNATKVELFTHPGLIPLPPKVVRGRASPSRYIPQRLLRQRKHGRNSELRLSCKSQFAWIPHPRPKQSTALTALRSNSSSLAIQASENPAVSSVSAKILSHHPSSPQ